MRLSRSATLYIAATLGAIATVAFFVTRDGVDTNTADRINAPLAHEPATLEALLDGTMKKLRFQAKPQTVSQAAFTAADGSAASLSDYRGKYVLLNFWATWCAPCREEMPMLSALQTEFGGENFEVVTIATGRNPPPAMATFFDEIGVNNLPLNRDPKQMLAREMGVLGLPVTLIIDPQGREIARMVGGAEWDSPSALTLIRTLVADPAT